MKWNDHDGLQGYGGPIFQCGLKSPPCQRILRVLIETLVDPLKHTNFAYAAITADHGIESDVASDIMPHEFERISGIDFLYGDRRGQITLDTFRHLGEMNHP